MTTDRRIFRLGGIALACSALLAAAPLAAHAGPLLSGYGGPGQGNQAILGSTLLGGSGGGSGNAGGPAGASEGVAAASAAGGLAEGTSSSSKSGASGRRRGSSSVTGLRGALGGQHGRPAPTGASGFYPAVEPAAASTPALGLSGRDILYIVLAAAALIGTGVLTRRMLRAGPAKGHS